MFIKKSLFLIFIWLTGLIFNPPSWTKRHRSGGSGSLNIGDWETPFIIVTLPYHYIAKIGSPLPTHKQIFLLFVLVPKSKANSLVCTKGEH